MQARANAAIGFGLQQIADIHQNPTWPLSAAAVAIMGDMSRLRAPGPCRP